MDKEMYDSFRDAPIKGEGQQIDNRTSMRTPEEMVEYLSGQLQQARIKEGKYNRVKRLAKRQQLMVANKNGFTLVEDLDEYLKHEAALGNSPLTRKEIIEEALGIMEESFAKNYGAAP